MRSCCGEIHDIAEILDGVLELDQIPAVIALERRHHYSLEPTGPRCTTHVDFIELAPVEALLARHPIGLDDQRRLPERQQIVEQLGAMPGSDRSHMDAERGIAAAPRLDPGIVACGPPDQARELSSL